MKENKINKICSTQLQQHHVYVTTNIQLALRQYFLLYLTCSSALSNVLQLSQLLSKALVDNTSQPTPLDQLVVSQMQTKSPSVMYVSLISQTIQRKVHNMHACFLKTYFLEYLRIFVIELARALYQTTFFMVKKIKLSSPGFCICITAVQYMIHQITTCIS